MQELSVVMSGFDPYEDVEVNPALIVPDTLAAQGIMPLTDDQNDPLHDLSVRVHAVHMPVSFAKAWPILQNALDEYKPNIVIATGLKRASRGILLERCAANIKDTNRPDADNRIPRHGVIRDDGPAAYWTGLPLNAIIGAFAQDDIAASLSSNAGTFVCNALFYKLQDWAARQERTLSGFVNLPPVDEHEHSQHGLTLDQQLTACRDVIRETARYYVKPIGVNALIA